MPPSNQCHHLGAYAGTKERPGRAASSTLVILKLLSQVQMEVKQFQRYSDFPDSWPRLCRLLDNRSCLISIPPRLQTPF